MKTESKPNSEPSVQEELDEIRESAGSDPAAIDLFAQLVRDQMCAMYLSGMGVSSPLAAVPIAALQRYVEHFVLDQVGDDCSGDPILKTLIEQLILAHQMIGRLYADAISATSIEARRVNVQLATSLAGELRRLSIEIREQSTRHHSDPLAIATVSAAKKRQGGKNKEESKSNVA